MDGSHSLRGVGLAQVDQVQVEDDDVGARGRCEEVLEAGVAGDEGEVGQQDGQRLAHGGGVVDEAEADVGTLVGVGHRSPSRVKVTVVPTPGTLSIVVSIPCGLSWSRVRVRMPTP